MYSYFQAYQAEWLHRNYFLFSSREQSKAIMGLTSEKEYVSWCFCCLQVIYEHRALDLPCLCGQCAARLGFVGQGLCALGREQTQGFYFLRKCRVVWMLTGWRDQSFVDWQERSALCWLAGEIKVLLTGRRDQSFVDRQEKWGLCWLAGIWKDQSFVDWQERSELCWLCVYVCAGCCVLLLPTYSCVSAGCWWTTSRSWRSITTSWGWSWKTDKPTEINSGYSQPPSVPSPFLSCDDTGWIIVSGLTTALFLNSSPRLGFCPCCVLISDRRLLVLHWCLSVWMNFICLRIDGAG